MTGNFFTILNIQETWESIIHQVNSLFDPEKFQFLGSLGLFWDKILDNPLTSIFTLLVLIGLPFTLFKAKESSTQANERLDRLMDEMKDFEYEEHLTDLQDEFKSFPIDNSPVSGNDQDASKVNREKEFPDLSMEENPVPQGLEHDSFTKKLTLDQELTDDFLATGPRDLQRETDDENPVLPSLEEKIFYETEISQPVEPSDEEEYSSQDTDDLQTRMEQAIKKLRLNYPSPEDMEAVTSGEINTDSVPMVLEAVQKPSTEETDGDENNDLSPPSSQKLPQKEDTSDPSSESIPPDSPAGGQEDSLKKSDLITHLKSFQKNLENQFDSKAHESGTNSNESPQEQNSYNAIFKPTGITSPAPNKTTDDESQESLESFLFSKDQKKPE